MDASQLSFEGHGQACHGTDTDLLYGQCRRDLVSGGAARVSVHSPDFVSVTIHFTCQGSQLPAKRCPAVAYNIQRGLDIKLQTTRLLP